MDIQILGSSSKGNCYHISGSSPLLLDAGITFKEIQRKTNFQISSIAGALITHEHMDHCKAVKDLLKAGVDCYMNQATQSALGVSGHRVKVIAPMQQFKVGEWTILPFSLEHDVDNLGYLIGDGIQKVVYITDSYYCRPKFTGLTHILIECNHSYEILDRNNLEPFIKNRLIKSHFSLENVKEFLRANDLSRVQEIYLIHLSDGNSDAELFKREIAELTGKMVFVGGA